MSPCCLLIARAACRPGCAARGPAQVPLLINYQGRLLIGTNLVNGSVGLSLRLFNTPAGGTSLYEDSNTVTVVDGLYSTHIGDNPTDSAFLEALTNAALYIEAAVNGTTLTPRERVASAGYSLATRGLLVTTNHSVALNPADNAMNVFSRQSAIGGGEGNMVNGDYNDVGGGEGNAVLYTDHSAIGGGFSNLVYVSQFSWIGGGQGNQIQSSAHRSTIGGGYFNQVESLAFFSAIAGGNQNIIRLGAEAATIPGGYANVIGSGASYSFAAGKGASAQHAGSFVWNDNGPFLGDFPTTDTNQFLVRASGGVGINTNRPGATLHVRGEAMIGPDDTAPRFAMKRVGMTSSGTVFVHPGAPNLIMQWDSASRVLLVTNTSLGTYCDVQMHVVMETNGSASATADISSVLPPYVVSLTNTTAENAGWTVTAAVESPTGGPGFQFNGTGWDNILNGLITYWY